MGLQAAGYVSGDAGIVLFEEFYGLQTIDIVHTGGPPSLPPGATAGNFLPKGKKLVEVPGIEPGSLSFKV